MNINKDGSISLPELPKEREYEDYIAAILQSSGYYLERGVILRGVQDVLELDIVATKYSRNDDNCINRSIFEIKSGKWGLSDIFKVGGWLQYLGIKNGYFIVQEPSDYMKDSETIASELNVSLVNNQLLDGTQLNEKLSIVNHDDNVVKCLRYSYAVEHEMIVLLRKELKRNPNRCGLKALKDYLFGVSCNSFFESDPVRRIEKLFNLYIENKNITARILEEESTNSSPDSSFEGRIAENNFRILFYEAKEPHIGYVALYTELLCRLMILKSCIEEVLTPQQSHGWLSSLRNNIPPQNVKNGMNILREHKYVHLYPYFWQVFIYLFGGFILLDKKDEEYGRLSQITGLPVEEIDNALKVFDLLYPIDSQEWIEIQPYTNIMAMRFFPLPFSGIGANFRRQLYTDSDNPSYEELTNTLTKYSGNDIVKWNNLAYRFLSLGVSR